MAPDRPGDPFPHPARQDLGAGPEGTVEMPPLPDLSFLHPPTEPDELGRLAQYRVLRLIGAGGMGMVFEAEDTHLQRRVALKVIRPDLAASLSHRTRFLKEARAAAALTSDYIATVFQVGQDNDVPFMAMQLLRGEPLDARLARERRLPLTDALVIAIQAAAGLAAAHEKGLVHRDVKPANLWLEADRPGGAFRRVRILDLGLVRVAGIGTQLTTAGVVVGTPHFMSPEQAGALPVDPRADLFSLGCVIYTMLSGELAFPGPSTMAVLMALANHTPPPLTVSNPEVPPELAALVARMMAKAPEDRPASAAEVIAQLDAILAAEQASSTGTPPPRARASNVVTWPTRRAPTPAPGAASGPLAETLLFTPPGEARVGP
ncbi:MAG: amiC, partial [Gemmataceae bacterium]|nr:amiC [Gemmataceae bacterium]